jgi:putative ABC transport system substrate-binding protein
MQRREFIALVGGASFAWPRIGRAQQSMPVVGFLNGAAPELYTKFLREFRRGLNEMGFVEGQNVVVEYRWAENHYERLPELAAELVRRQVTVIAATSTPAALAAKATNTKIPIVFTTASDPVALGWVANLARPAGNMTGATQLNMELGPKRLELMRQLLPDASSIALVINPSNPRVAEVQTMMRRKRRALLDCNCLAGEHAGGIRQCRRGVVEAVHRAGGRRRRLVFPQRKRRAGRNHGAVRRTKRLSRA